MGIAYRYFGFLSFRDGDGLRFTWLQIVLDWGIGLYLINWGPDHDHNGPGSWSLTLHPVFFRVFLNLPGIPDRKLADTDGMLDEWGASWRWNREDVGHIHLRWGARYKFLQLPWSWEWQRSSVLRTDGEWLHDRKAHKLGDKRADWDARENAKKLYAWSETHPYRYVLRSGEVQERQATIEVHELEWRMRWLQWLPWRAMVRRSIDVKFDHEVGERSGSWKGGAMGCGYELEPGETPLECLRRMERERKF